MERREGVEWGQAHAEGKGESEEPVEIRLVRAPVVDGHPPGEAEVHDAGGARGGSDVMGRGARAGQPDFRRVVGHVTGNDRNL